MKQIKLLLLLVVSTSIFSLNNGENVELSTESYPITLEDSKGRIVTIEKRPSTIISVAPNITEIIYSLGGGDLLVGRSDFCDYPEETSNVPSVGTLFEPNIEKMVELNPEVIIAGTHFQKEIVDKLEETGIKVVIVQEEDSIEGVYSAIETIGLIIDRRDEAKNEVDSIKNTLINLKEVKNSPRVYYVVGFGEYGDYTAGGDTYINELIETAGGINVASDSVGWTYSLEKIIEHNPDIVICSKYYGTPDSLKEAIGYKDLPAILEGRLYPIDNNVIDRPGPRLSEGLILLNDIFSNWE